MHVIINAIIGFTTLAKHLQNDNLEQLDLRTCSGFNNKCLEQLGSKLTNLTALDLTMTGVKGDEAMILIGKYCTKLKVVTSGFTLSEIHLAILYLIILNMVLIIL